MNSIVFKYLHYKLFAGHKKGHGIHSPYVYSFVRQVLADRNTDDKLRYLEIWCKRTRREKIPVSKNDPGAGSKSANHLVKKAGKIGVSCKYGKMLYRLAEFISPLQVIELGTGSGIATGFITAGAWGAKVITVDGDTERLAFAQNNLNPLRLKNIEFVHADFDSFLDKSRNILHPFFVFIDGNHRYAPTLNYFDFFASRAEHGSVIVFDDIRWSGEMEKAWHVIRKDPRVSVTVDLFFMGLVFFREGIARQDFIINF